MRSSQASRPSGSAGSTSPRAWRVLAVNESEGLARTVTLTAPPKARATLKPPLNGASSTASGEADPCSLCV